MSLFDMSNVLSYSVTDDSQKTNPMVTKAKLTITLKADSTIVAESDDAGLWQRVLASIHSGTHTPDAKDGDAVPEVLSLSTKPEVGAEKAIASFAKSLGVTTDQLTGALSPSREPPYLNLDGHCWAAMKKATPQRGPGALSATGFAGTVLVLWFKEAKIDVGATQALAAAVLDTIDVKDPNPSRGIKNTKWLQSRSGGSIVINAAEIAKAQEIARAFCTKQWPGIAK